MKKILITGAGTGIGKDAAITLATRGHLVYATTFNKSQAKKLNKIAYEKKIPLISFKLNILSKKDRSLVDNLKLDVLINNAAIGDSGSVSEINVNRYRKTFETNVFSHIELTQHVLKNMIKCGSGRVIFISSLIGRVSLPFLSPYTSTKFAIEAIASSLRNEMHELKNAKIDVALIEPGAYHTGFNQENISKQFIWMKKNSYFKNQLTKLKAKQYLYFDITECKSTKSIVKEYINAVEDESLKERYIAPLTQGTYIQLKRVLGK